MYRTQTATLTSTASDPDNDPLTYNWTITPSTGYTLTDGTSATATFSATTLGTYTVTLTVTDPSGATATATSSIVVYNRQPTATPSADEGPSQYAGATFHLHANANDPDSADTLSYTWTLDAHPTGAYTLTGADTANPVLTTSTSPGDWNFTLTVTDGNPSNGTLIVPFTVTTTNSTLPTAAFTFTPDNALPNTTIQFTDHSSESPPGTIISWNWTFGDGSGSTDQNATHAYTAAGNYTVTLTITDNGGNTAQATQTVHVNAAPSASFTVSQQTVVGQQTVVTVASTSRDPDGSITAYAWTLAGPTGSKATLNSSTSATSGFTADVPGTYTVTLKVTDNNGATDSVSHDIAVANINPVIDSATASPVHAGNDSALSASAHDPDGGTLTSTWTITSGSGGSISQPDVHSGAATLHTSSQPQTYTLNLTVTDGQGGSASANVTVTTTNTAPTANIAVTPSATPIVRGTTVTFDASGSTDPEHDTLTYAWTLSQPSGSTDALSAAAGSQVTLKPSTLGDYTVTLTVDDGHGGTNTTTATITVENQAPTANAGTNQQVHAGTDAQLHGTASDGDSPTYDTLTYTWSIDATATAGASLSGANTLTPTLHTPAQPAPGTFPLTFTVNDGHTTASAHVTVTTQNTAPSAGTITVSPSSVYRTQTATLTSTASDPDNDPLTYNWTITPSTGYTLTDGTSATATFSATTLGTYTVTLTVTDPSGATATATSSIVVYNRQPTATPSADEGPSQYAGATFHLHANANDPDSADTLSYTWTLDAHPTGAYTLTGADTANPVLTTSTSPGDWNFTLTVTDGNPSNGTLIVPFTVTTTNSTLPTAAFTFTPDNALPNTTIQFTDHSSNPHLAPS